MKQDKFGTIAVDEVGKSNCSLCVYNDTNGIMMLLGHICNYCMDNNTDNEYYINKKGKE